MSFGIFIFLRFFLMRQHWILDLSLAGYYKRLATSQSYYIIILLNFDYAVFIHRIIVRDIFFFIYQDELVTV